jgi:hypothetical protein
MGAFPALFIIQGVLLGGSRLLCLSSSLKMHTGNGELGHTRR